MLGFSFSFSLAAGERYGVLDGDGKEGKEEGRKEGRMGKRRKEGRKEGRKGGRKEGKEEGRGGANRLQRQHAGRDETVEIACGELRWEGARQHAGQRRNRANIFSLRELRWEGARQHAGPTGNRANSLWRAFLGGSETACWTERKPCK